MKKIKPSILVITALFALSGFAQAATFSPYYDFALRTDNNPPAADEFTNLAKTADINHLTLAFIAARYDFDPKSGLPNYYCDAAWAGLADYRVANQWGVLPFQSFGPDKLTISIGGAFGPYLFEHCNNSQSLAAQYQNIVKTYGVTHLDFDIENWSVNEPEARQRMIDALAIVQKQNPKVTISFTLPLIPEQGFSAPIVDFLTNAAQKIQIAEINVMAMDYYWTPDNCIGKPLFCSTEMTLPILEQQLQAIFPHKTKAEIYQMLRITPMIGQNDAPLEQFTLDDANQLYKIATQNKMNLAMWEMRRDFACPSDVKSNYDSNKKEYLPTRIDCSGTFDTKTGALVKNHESQHYQYAHVFEQINTSK